MLKLLAGGLAGDLSLFRTLEALAIAIRTFAFANRVLLIPEEGINNIEALAHADIVDLMSSTRISAAELVDWTDQAMRSIRAAHIAKSCRRCPECS